MVSLLFAFVITPLKHSLSKNITAEATVDISIDSAIQPSKADFFKFRILETVNDGGSCGCLSRNCSFRLFFNVLSLTNNITELIIGPEGMSYCIMFCHVSGNLYVQM